jgi:hypothetical protein
MQKSLPAISRETFTILYAQDKLICRFLVVSLLQLVQGPA